MKTFGQIWRVWVFKCRAQEDLANQNIIRGRKDESEDQFAIIWCVVFFKNIMFYFQWKILFWLLPTVWWMIMFIIVSYLLGWPHKKLTMSLIDLFPSANDVSTELHVARVHNVLLAIIDSYYLPLMIILIICCEQEEYHLKTLPQNIWCCEALTDSPSSDQGLQCLWHQAGHWTMGTGRRDSG